MTTTKLFSFAALATAALVALGQDAPKKPTGATNGTIVTGLLAMSAFDPLLDREYVLNVIEEKNRVTVQLFRTDGRQKINAVLVRKDAKSEFRVLEVRAVPPMDPTTSTDANSTVAFALAMLSHGKDVTAEGYKGLKLRGQRIDDGNVFVGLISPPYNPSFGSHYILTPKGTIVSSGHGY
ncbi:MAG: hypothetical protein WD716_04455 [Fimbriimonadaceae bacterium]